MSGAAALGPALVELRSALAAGAPPAVALQDALRRQPDALAALARPLRDMAVGMPLEQAAAALADDEGAAALLLRALAVAERAGVGASEAVAQGERAVAEELELARLLRVRTVRARGSLRVLALAPPAAVGFFLLLEPAAAGFYGTPLGRVSAAVSLALLLVARRWARAIVDGVPAAVGRADPLGRAAGGGAAETAELLAVALAGGLPHAGAVRLVADLGPPAARPVLRRAEAALAAGVAVDAAFAATPLRDLGAVLGAATRWGASARELLSAYAAGLRADRRAALAEVAERTELRLVFPTTLLTLPSFLLAVVPPLLWTGLRR
ncbi:MAG TPA: type II secretion system F family protein [Egibacteraceae bacterium]|nr:type II secretion system F family protein [Egibacteraceae bacterium]